MERIRRDRAAARFPAYAAVLVIVIGVVVLLGWLAGSLTPARIRQGWPPMYPRTAVWIVALPAALLLQTGGSRRSEPPEQARPADWGGRVGRAVIARALAGLIGLSAVVALVEFLADGAWAHRLDAFWFNDLMAELEVAHPGRPSAPTAMAVIALSALVAAVRVEARLARLLWVPAQVVALSLPALALAGYAFNALDVLATSMANGMSLPTAVGLLLVALAAMAARPDRPILSWFLDRPDRVTLARLGFVLLGLPAGVWLVRLAAAQYLPDEHDRWLVAVLVATLGVAVAVNVFSSGQQRDLYTKAALRDEAEAERSLLRVSADALLDPQVLLVPRWDDQGRVVDLVLADVNRAACRATGATREDLLGSPIGEAAPDLAVRDLIDAFIGVAERGELLELDDHVSVPDPGGEPRIHAVRAVRVPGGRVSVTWRDVTEEKLRAQRLADSERRYRLLASNTADVVAQFRAGVFQFVSPSVATALGWRPDELVGRRIDGFIHPDDRDWVLERRRAVEHGEVARLRYRFRAADGTYHWVEVVASPLPDDEAGTGGIVTNVRVVDAAVRSEAELKHARAAAEVAAAAKAAFLANMSHEIRTPLTAVLGLLRLLLDSDLNEIQRNHTERAERSARSLLGILNDILDFSKIEAGALELHEEAFSFDALLRGLGAVLAANLGSKPVDIVFDLDPAAPDRVVGDELRLRQVLLNLCGNALKFTAEGHVRVTSRVVRQTEERVILRVGVEDTGIGMSPEALVRVAESFAQATPEIARTHGGTGLGLAIATRLLDLMGSRLEVASTSGVGSTFSFELALARPPDTEARTATGPGAGLTVVAPEQLRVLLVGGGEALREAVERMCMSFGWGFRATRAEPVLSGAPAPATGGPDVVLIDVPDPAGRDADLVTRLRRRDAASAETHIDGPARRRPLVLVLTTQAGLASPAVAGADGHVVKPFTSSALLDAIVSFRTGTPFRRARPARVPRLAGLHILLVDDNEITREVTAEMLGRERAVVTAAANGRQAVDLVLADPTAFDAVLMDQQMPVLDGLAATREIRASGRASTLPILAITANATHDERQACLDAGMNDHVAKPFELDDLVERIRRWVSAAPGGGDPGPGGGATSDSDAPSDSGDSHAPGPLPVLDTAAGLARVGDDVGFYGAMLARFATGLAERVAALEDAAASGDETRTARLAHALVGAAATLGAARLSASARRLEEAAQAGGPTHGSAQLAALTDAAARTSAEAASWHPRAPG